MSIALNNSIAFCICVAMPAHSWQFSSEFLQEAQVQQQPAVYIIQKEQSCIEKRTTEETIKNLIDVAALAYGIVKVYQRYSLHHDPATVTYWQRLLSYVYPAPCKQIATTAHFFVDATIIVGKTVLYKTVARMIVSCFNADITDAIEAVGMRIKKLIKKIVI